MNNERFPNGSLDGWLRGLADHGDEQPAPDGWDAPSGQVWTRVREGLRRRKRRRRAFWWLVLAVSTVGSPALWQLRRAMPQAAGRPAHEAAPALSAPTIVLAPSVSRHEPAPGVIAAPLFQLKTKPEKTDRTLIFNFQKNKNSVRNHQQSAPSPPPDALDSEQNLAAKPAAIATSSLTTTLPLRYSPTEPVASLAPIVVSQSSIPSFHAPLLPSGQRFIAPEKSPSAIRFGATTGLFFTTRTLRGGTTGQLNGTEHGAWTWQGGLTAAYVLDRHWALETGLQWTAVQLRAERRSAVRFRSDQERYNPSRDVYETSTRQALQTSFGEVELRLDLSRRAGQVIHNQEVIRLSLQTDERVRYLRLPLSVGYRSGGERWQWSVHTGLGFSVRTDYELTVTAAHADRLAIRTVNARAERRAAGLAAGMVDAQLGLGLAYRLTPHWSVAVAPELRQGLSSMTRQTAFRAYPVSAGIQLRLTWQLP